MSATSDSRKRKGVSTSEGSQKKQKSIGNKKWNSIVLKIDGTYETMQLSGLSDYKKQLGGYIQMLPGNSIGKSVAYVNEEGLLKRLPQNGWSWLLDLLGYNVPWAFGGVMGNCVICKFSASSKKKYLQILQEVDNFKRDEDYDLDELCLHITKCIELAKNTVKYK